MTHKKLFSIIIFFVSVGLVFNLGPFSAKAQTIEDLRVLINQLQIQVAQLQAKISLKTNPSDIVAKIDYPNAGEIIWSPSINIVGTATGTSYTVFYCRGSSVNNNECVQIGSGTYVKGDILAKWNVGDLSSGQYFLKLIVNSSLGEVNDVVEVRIWKDTQKGYGFIVGKVVDKVTKNPIANARVEILELNLSVQSDKNGKFEFPSIYIDEHSERFVTLKASATGYGSHTMIDVGVFPKITATVTLEMNKGNVSTQWFGLKYWERPVSSKGPTMQLTPEYYSETVPPPSIRIAIRENGTNGYPDPQGRVIRTDVVDFDFYIKHVLPSEWLANWPTESLKTGAMGVKTYGWYWVNRGGKYPQYNADLDNSVNSQVYNPNLSYSSTDSAVDLTNTVGAHQNGVIFQSQYCAGSNDSSFSCGSNRMSQWGSYYWVNQGKDYQWILGYYYSPTLTYFAISSQCSSLNYPSDKWQRVWYTYPAKECLGTGPDELGEKFDNNFGQNDLGYGKKDYVQFSSSKTINISTQGTYRITLGSDDGVSLWVDDVKVIDKWIDRSYATNSVELNLSSGNHKFRIDYYENTVDARVSFNFEKIPAALQIVTKDASNVLETQAQLNGEILDLGGPNSVNVWFRYGTTQNYGNETKHQNKTSTGGFNETIIGLSPNTTYYFRAVASNGNEISYGAFKTNLFASLIQKKDSIP